MATEFGSGRTIKSLNLTGPWFPALQMGTMTMRIYRAVPRLKRDEK